MVYVVRPGFTKQEKEQGLYPGFRMHAEDVRDGIKWIFFHSGNNRYAPEEGWKAARDQIPDTGPDLFP
ncbi:MAG: hypothetical protein IPH04_09565 [Saprospirales bacterium]|nr:hypothetical protein [Saprospirales bacterium]